MKLVLANSHLQAKTQNIIEGRIIRYRSKIQDRNCSVRAKHREWTRRYLIRQKQFTQFRNWMEYVPNILPPLASKIRKRKNYKSYYRGRVTFTKFLQAYAASVLTGILYSPINKCSRWCHVTLSILSYFHLLNLQKANATLTLIEI